MVNPGNQIFDLLLGDIGLPSSPQQPEAGDGAENPYFSVVFTSLLDVAKPTHDTVNPLRGEMPLPGGESPLLLSDELIAKAPCEVASPDEDGLQVPQVWSNIMKGQPVRVLAAGEQAGATLPIQLSNLEPGRYEILDSWLQGDVLRITAANGGDKSTIFSISIPLEQLRGGPGLRVVPDARQNPTEQQPFKWQGLRLEEYLAKLNLKAIEVTPAHKSVEAESPAKAMEFAILADDAGQKIVIRSYPFKKDLQVWREENPSGSKVGRGQRGIGRMVAVGDNAATKAQADPVTNPPQVFTKITPASKNQYRFQDDFSFENLKVSGDRNELSSTFEEGETFTVLEKLSSDAEAGHRRLNIQAVRFTLPDNVKSGLKPGVQTVMLRIEPEHLGPAKLSLTMYNDKLCARLVVNSALAKVAVEASLHHLVEQLSRANIEIDHIQVAVGGESAHDGVFERRPQWRYRANRFGKFNLNDSLSSVQQAVAVAPPPRAVSYVGADGVNLLA